MSILISYVPRRESVDLPYGLEVLYLNGLKEKWGTMSSLHLGLRPRGMKVFASL